MADSANKKPAAKKQAASKKPAVANVDFEGPEPDAPEDEMTPQEHFERDEKKAKALEDVRKVEDKQAGELQEVRDIHAAQRERWRHHDRTETSGVVYGIKDPDKDPNKSGDALDGPALRVFTGDGRCHIETDGEVVLDQNGVIDLRAKLDAAFQAVS